MVGVDEAVEDFLIVGNKEQRVAGLALFLQQAQHALDAEKIENAGSTLSTSSRPDDCRYSGGRDASSQVRYSCAEKSESSTSVSVLRESSLKWTLETRSLWRA